MLLPSVSLLVATAPLGTASQAVMTSGHVHTELSFRITLNAAADRAIRAFGPAAERGWDPDWHPHYIFPSEPSDCEGAVFTVDSGNVQTWLVQTWDMHDRVVRYVAFDPEVKLTEITIRVSPLDQRHSKAEVSYRRTGLSITGDEQIRRWAAEFASQAPHWAEAINSYLAKPHP